jgi:hypothetical protein
MASASWTPLGARWNGPATGSTTRREHSPHRRREFVRVTVA